MEVRAKKALGQHFLTDQGIAMTIVDSLEAGGVRNVLEIGPGMGVLTQYLLKRDDIDLKLVELDGESVEYLLTHFPGMQGKLYEMDYLKLDVHLLFPGEYRVIFVDHAVLWLIALDGAVCQTASEVGVRVTWLVLLPFKKGCRIFLRAVA